MCTEKAQKKKKRQTGRRSVHATTPEQNRHNRELKKQKADLKQRNKEKRLASKKASESVLSKVDTWAKDNPILPSQDGPKPQPRKFKKTYKAFIRNLPKE